MLASDKLIAEFNQQIGNELGASHLYISIASYFDSEALAELSKFFDRQSEEERGHAMKFVRFILDIGGRVEIPATPQPKADFASAEEAVATALQSEETVTQQIYALVETAKSDGNHIASRFLDWFVTEQLEEVATMNSLLQVVRRAGGSLMQVEEFLAREGLVVDAPPEG